MTRDELIDIIRKIQEDFENGTVNDPEIDSFAEIVEKEEDLQTLLMLKRIMSDDVAKFTYVKKGGETRVAYGTRDPKIINSITSAAPPADKKRTSAVFSYFDIEKMDWRCFLPQNLHLINTEYVTE